MRPSRRWMLGGATMLFSVRTRPAWAADLTSRVFTPEAFGAIGDGKTNDSAAFDRLSIAVNAAGGGIVRLRKTVYIVGAQSHRSDGGWAYQPAPLLHLSGCTKPLIISGNGAVLRCAPHLRYGAFDTTGAALSHKTPFMTPGTQASPYQHMILAEECSGPIVIENIELDGASGTLVVGGPWGDTGWQIPAIGVYLRENRGTETLRNLYLHHHAQDGLLLSGPREKAGARSITQVRSHYNGRQGCSIIGGRDISFVACSFSHNGRGKISSAPAAGVDIEAEAGPVRALRFRDCRFEDNSGCGLVADSGDSADVRFDGCTFIGTSNWSAWPNKPLFRFTDCHFEGPVVRCFSSANPAEATQFLRCDFIDRNRVAATSLPPNGPIADLSDSRNVRFTKCRFSVSHGAALPWSIAAIYSDCVMTQRGGSQGYPRGTYLGTTRINGNVDLAASDIRGTVSINGRIR